MEVHLEVGKKYYITDAEGEEQDRPWIYRGIRDGAEGRKYKFSDAGIPTETFEVDAEDVASAEPVFEEEEEKEEEEPFQLFQVNKDATNLKGTRTNFESCYVRDPSGANCALLSTATLGLVAPEDINLFISMPGSSDVKGTLLPILRASGGRDVHPVGFDLDQMPTVLTFLRTGYVTLFSFYSKQRAFGHTVLLERRGDTEFRLLDQQNANREGFASIQTGTLADIEAYLRKRKYDEFMVFEGPTLDTLSPPRLIDTVKPTQMDPKLAYAYRIAQEQRAKREAEVPKRGEAARAQIKSQRRPKGGRRTKRAKPVRRSTRKATRFTRFTPGRRQ